MIEIFLWIQVVDKGVIIIHKHVSCMIKVAVLQIAVCFWLAAAGCQAARPAMSPAMVDISRNPEGRILCYEKKATNVRKSKKDPEVETESNDYKFESPQESIMFANVYVNLREEPTTESQVLSVLRPNTEVSVLACQDGWCQVCCGEGSESEEWSHGYIKEEYLSAEQLQPTELNKWQICLTQEEIDLLAKILWVEARGEPYEGQAAVIEVIFNRMISQDSDFPENDLEGIVSSKNNGVQFASWRLRDTAEPTDNLYQVIYDVLEGKVEVLPSTDYVFFTTGGIGRNIIRIGNHRFGTQ